ncbi:MAG: alanine racemase [Gammaproteobacteria bacterium]|nr:alanine racemase [Gammaproteobacteria bacterium]
MSYGSRAIVNLKNLQHNLSRVRELSPDSKILAMIKSDGYGHGFVHILNALDAADGFGVASIDEAMRLKEAGAKKPILIMRGFSDVAELELIAKHGFLAVIHDHSQLEILENIKLANAITVWLKVDTGMHRLGFMPDELKDVHEFLRANTNIKTVACLLSHFSDADSCEKVKTGEQLTQFNEVDIACPKSFANSAGIICWPAAHFDWVRPGIMLYGVTPISDKVGADYNLKPVMTLKSKLIAVKNITAGGCVGYGEKWRCPNDMRIGVVAIGYGDGYPRHAENGTPVLVNNISCPLVGRVSMDMLTVDLTNNPMAKVNDEVILWGEDLPVEIIAKCADTITYELLCQLTGRVRFTYV